MTPPGCARRVTTPFASRSSRLLTHIHPRQLRELQRTHSTQRTWKGLLGEGGDSAFSTFKTSTSFKRAFSTFSNKPNVDEPGALHSAMSQGQRGFSSNSVTDFRAISGTRPCPQGDHRIRVQILPAAHPHNQSRFTYIESLFLAHTHLPRQSVGGGKFVQKRL